MADVERQLARATRDDTTIIVRARENLNLSRGASRPRSAARQAPWVYQSPVPPIWEGEPEGRGEPALPGVPPWQNVAGHLSGEVNDARLRRLLAQEFGWDKPAKQAFAERERGTREAFGQCTKTQPYQDIGQKVAQPEG